MHKHFRMIALSEYLRNHGYDPTVDKHTRIPAVWEKLGTLYNMDIIDAREDSFDDDEGESNFVDFELPGEDYGRELFMRGKRSPSEAPSSPPRLERSPSPLPTRKRTRGDTVTAPKTRASTVDDTDEARTSPARSPPGKTTRSGRSTTRAMERTKAQSSSRPRSKDTTMDEDDGEEETEETAEDDEHEAEEEDGSVSPKASKAASKAKGDPAAKTSNPSRKSKRKR
jgi:MRG-binding protein